MLRLIGIVLSIGLADSINPTTLAPALYLASLEAAIRRVLSYTLGVFTVMLVGGLIVALGPGQLLLSLVPHPRPIVEYWLEVSAGVVLVVISTMLWRFRQALAARDLLNGERRGQGRRRSSLLLGAGLMLFEFPTAFPYFAAIATIVGSDRPVAEQAGLVALYSLCFVMPLLGIALVLRLSPERAGDVLVRARQLIQERWPEALAIVLTLAGVFCLLLGGTGVASHLHDRFAPLARHLHHLITHP